MDSKYQMLRQYFGYESFRSTQAEIIDNILMGHDALGIMPTGAGKSICFQIPALIIEGITLVISPLISLMKDQVNTLVQSGINAAFINSSLTERQISIVLNNAQNGMYKLIYIAPERLNTPEFISFTENVKIAMLTVDEAHCISQWGQDFRPSYTKISEFIKTLSYRPIISAFTATATPNVRQDIVNLLELKEPNVVVSGFDRANLFFKVVRLKDSDKFYFLSDYIKEKKDFSGIVYCSTRNTVDEVCDKLCKKGYNALPYHAGLSDKLRHKNQDNFLYDHAKIMVATNAFGMGIDKSNVSYVVHYNMPKDIESYYQEAGRAGRDGENADCILLYSKRDVMMGAWLIDNNRDTEHLDAQTAQLLKERSHNKLREMTFYSTTDKCLRRFILNYFAETTSAFCGNCSNCNSNFDTVDITIDAQKILSCVARSGERFGIQTIIGVLRGSKNAKISEYGLDKLSTFNICEKSSHQLNEIVDFLLINNYLTKTDTTYPIVKLGVRASEILKKNCDSIYMKILRDEIVKPAADTVTMKLKPINRVLLEKLKALRMDISQEQSVPAFVVFTDSTINDMCRKTPTKDDEFLEVSGVGHAKLERYGKQFLAVINEFLLTDISNTDLEEEKLSLKEIAIEETDVPISAITDKINCVLMQNGQKKTTSQKINDWLVFKNLLRIVSPNGNNFKIATDAGIDVGITSNERIVNGRERMINLYNRKAQEFIVQNIDELMEFLG